jgi:hypothetical protein
MTSVDKVVTVVGVAQLARPNFWPYSERPQVGVLSTGEPVSVRFGTMIVNMRPDKNRKGY